MREVPVLGAGEVVDAAAREAAMGRQDGLGGGLLQCCTAV
jgi:hypothetical protein